MIGLGLSSLFCTGYEVHVVRRSGNFDGSGIFVSQRWYGSKILTLNVPTFPWSKGRGNQSASGLLSCGVRTPISLPPLVPISLQLGIIGLN